MKVSSHLHPRDYLPNEVCRILNPKQQRLYIKNHVYPIDIYTSIDSKTSEDVVVMIFLKSESADVYSKWMNYELE